MNVSFDWYNVFYYVCEFKNVTKAANFLCVSQPAITRHIRNLEKALGKKLITKTPKGIELTNDGKLLYNEIKTPIENLHLANANFNAKSDDYDTVIIINAGVSTTRHYLLNVLAKFNKKHPNVKFTVNSSEYKISFQKLREGKSDLIFYSSEERVELGNNIIEQGWKSINDAFVISSKIKDKYPDFISIKDLNNYPIVCKKSGGTGRRNLEKEFEKVGLKFLPTYQLSHNWLVEEYVKMGLGMGLVIKELVEEKLESGELVEIKTDINLPKRKYVFAYSKTSDKLNILKELIEELKKV